MEKHAASANEGINRLAPIRRFGFLLLMTGTISTANAQILQTPDSEEQRRRSQAEAFAREARLRASRAALPAAAPFDATALTLPAESPCYTLRQFVLEVPHQLAPASQLAGASDFPHDPFRFAHDYLQQYAGACMGKHAGLNLITERLNSLIQSKGYLASRVVIPAQDLSTGVLTLTLIPGVIRAIRFSDPNLYGTWKNAFPTGPGRLLKLRDVEQGLEQMKRLPSQDVDMHLVPTEVPGESDVVLDVKRSRPWKFTANLDDGGAKGTGKLQAGLNLGIDNPLGLSDMFNIGINTDADRKAGQHGTSGNNLYYAMPVGYWNVALSGSSYDYHQQIAGNNQDYVSSGKSRNLEFKITHLFQRDESQKNSWQFKAAKRWSRAFIDDTEIAVQKRNTTFVELGWMHKHYFGNVQLDLTLANRWGTPWLGGQRNPDGRPSEYPTFMYTLQSIDATLVAPFSIASQPVTYTGTFRGQNTRSPLYLTDQFSIGGRYTVRGFDGELTLAGERGFYFRNELELPIAGTGQSAYAGVDIGKVYGPSVQYLLGDKLAGASIGVRGRYKGFTYDLFAGWPLYKPEQFTSATPSLGFSLIYQY